MNPRLASLPGIRSVIQLQTAFGGGKTHTMLAVLHLASRKCPLSELQGIPTLVEQAGLMDVPQTRVTSNAHGFHHLLERLLDGLQRKMLVDLQAPLALVPRDQLDLGVGQALRGQEGQHLVPEEVGVDVLGDARPVAVPLHDLLHPARGERHAAPRLEEIAVLRVGLQMAAEDEAEAPGEQDVAVLAALAPVDEDLALLGVHVLDPDADQLEAQPEPENLLALKADLAARWPMTGLLDMLKETDLRVGFSDAFRSATAFESMDRATLQQRLLLCLYGLGTNTGLKRMSAGSTAPPTRTSSTSGGGSSPEDHCGTPSPRWSTPSSACACPQIWGEGTTACASDSKKFGAWDQNLLTEWHVRYGGRGVMIYWHVEKKAACIYSQLKTCSSSEVAAMIEGVLRHCTEMAVDRQYVDSHGQSEVAFAFCRLLGFQLLPRLKAIHRQKLYRPEAGKPEAFPQLAACPVPPDQLGPDPPAVRRDGQVRHRPAPGDGGDRGDPAAVHAQQRAAPDVQGAGRAGQGAQDDLPVPLPAIGGAAPRDPRRAERGRELEQRQRVHPLRQGRGVRRATGTRTRR